MRTFCVQASIACGRRPALIALWLVAGFGPAAAQTGALWQQCVTGAAPAIAACTAIIQSGRETPRNTAIAHYNLGVAYMAVSDFGRAVETFERAIRLDPAYAVAYTKRGLAYEALGNRTRAQDDFRAAMRLAEARGAGKSFEEQWAERTARQRLGAAAPLARPTKPPEGVIDLPPPPVFEPPQITVDSFSAPRVASPGPQAKSSVSQKPIMIDLPPPPVFEPPQITADSLSTTGANALSNTQPNQAAPPSPPAVVAVAPRPAAPLSLPLAAPRTDSGRRVALVIGNSAYQKVAALPNPVRDATSVATMLRGLGFQHVTLELDLSRDRLLDTLRVFAAEAEKAEWAVIYFAGHGIEMSGTNYLIPVEAKLATDRDVDYEAVALDKVINAVEGAKRLRLVLLDACRDNPFVRQMRRSVASRSIGRGLAQMEPEAGTLVVYAAKHGQVALDGDDGNSPFVTALMSRMKTPGLEVRRLFDLVRDDVMSSTNRRQQPFSYGSISGSEDFYFVATQ